MDGFDPADYLLCVGAGLTSSEEMELMSRWTVSDEARETLDLCPPVDEDVDVGGHEPPGTTAPILPRSTVRPPR